MERLKIGILDDDSSKVTQIMNCLIKGVDGANKEKITKYQEFKLDPIEIKIKNDIEKLIKEVIDKKIDCMIIDYKLSSFGIINFNGIEFAKELFNTLYDFPIFILTSYEDDLFCNEVYDAYKIFDFGRYLREDSERIEFNFKIIEQVCKTKKQFLLWENELLDLISRKGESAEIDSRIIDLDTKIERSLNGRFSFSKKKKIDWDNKLDELITKLDEIIKEDL
ncbi:hypothetical protein [Parvimonas micra]